MLNECMNKYRREVYQLLADNPAIELKPANGGRCWMIEVPTIAMTFEESTSLDNWSSVLIWVRAAVAAFKAYEATEKEVGRVSIGVGIDQTSLQ